MSWVYLKVRKPTEADGDEHGNVLVQQGNGIRTIIDIFAIKASDVAWMKIPELIPLPDLPAGCDILQDWEATKATLPDGYELLSDYTKEPHPEAMMWLTHSRRWDKRKNVDPYKAEYRYAVPIEPAEPEPRQYRPFVNMEEFKPYRHLWWKKKDLKRLFPPMHYDDSQHGSFSWYARFQDWEFEDGRPFGVPINDVFEGESK